MREGSEESAARTPRGQGRDCEASERDAGAKRSGAGSARMPARCARSERVVGCALSRRNARSERGSALSVCTAARAVTGKGALRYMPRHVSVVVVDTWRAFGSHAVRSKTRRRRVVPFTRVALRPLPSSHASPLRAPCASVIHRSASRSWAPLSRLASCSGASLCRATWTASSRRPSLARRPRLRRGRAALRRSLPQPLRRRRRTRLSRGASLRRTSARTTQPAWACRPSRSTRWGARSGPSPTGAPHNATAQLVSSARCFSLPPGAHAFSSPTHAPRRHHHHHPLAVR